MGGAFSIGRKAPAPAPPPSSTPALSPPPTVLEGKPQADQVTAIIALTPGPQTPSPAQRPRRAWETPTPVEAQRPPPDSEQAPRPPPTSQQAPEPPTGGYGQIVQTVHSLPEGSRKLAARIAREFSLFAKQAKSTAWRNLQRIAKGDGGKSAGNEEAAEEHPEVLPHSGSELGDGRTIRVFLSSTFRDMQNERTELFAKAAPLLQAECAARGLFLVFIDLRWGITSEDASGGKVLLQCLREVERSNFVVFFAKSRYGWHIPPGGSDPLLQKTLEVAAQQYSFVRWYPHASVTELEIRLGALLNPEAARGRALFYFGREAQGGGGAGSGPPGLPEGPEGDEGPYARQKLRELRAEVERAGLPVGEYEGPEGLARAVVADLTALLDRRYPRRDPHTFAEEEELAHETFAETRRHLYVARPELYRALDAYAAGEGGELCVVTGPVGVGKSALLANWADHHARRGAPPAPSHLFLHFAGGSQHSARASTLVRRLHEWLQERFPHLPPFVPSDNDAETLPAFATWLEERSRPVPPPAPTSARGGRRGSAPPPFDGFTARVVLVVDGAEEVEASAPGGQRPRAGAVSWIPSRASPLLRVIVSVGGGETLEGLRRRRGEGLLREIAVEPLPPPAVADLVKADLRAAGKGLTEEQVARVVAGPLSRIPVALKTLLAQIKATAVHETLDREIDVLLECSDALALNSLVLARLQASYSHAFKSAVCLVACSRRGLSEHELQALLAGPARPAQAAGEEPAEPAPVSPLAFSEMFAAARFMLASRGGFFTFSHRTWEEAVEGKFRLADERARLPYHRTLAAFFAAQEPSDRRAGELPWQLLKAGRRAEAAEALSELDTLARLRGDLSVVEAWRATGLADEAPDRLERAVAEFEGRVGARLAALDLNADPAASARFYAALSNHLTDCGLLLRALGFFSRAVPLLQKSLHARERLYAADGEVSAEEASKLALAASNLGALLEEVGEFKKAVPLLQRALELQRPGTPSWASYACNLAAALRNFGEFGRAEALLSQAAGIIEAAHGPLSPSLAPALQGLAAVYSDSGASAQALALHQRVLAIQEGAYGARHTAVAAALNNVAFALQQQERPGEALPFLQRAQRVYVEIYGEEHPALGAVLNNMGEVLRELGRTREAVDCFERSLQVRQAAFGVDNADVATSLNNLGSALEEAGDLDRALPLLELSLKIREHVFGPAHASTSLALNNLADAYKRRGRLEADAIPRYERALEIMAVVHGEESKQALTTVENLAMAYDEAKLRDKAAEAYERALALTARLFPRPDDRYETSVLCSNLAMIYEDTGRAREAAVLYRRAVAGREARFGRESGEVALLLQNLGGLLVEIEELPDAVECLSRAVAIYAARNGPRHPETSAAADFLATVYESVGEEVAAADIRQRHC